MKESVNYLLLRFEEGTLSGAETEELMGLLERDETEISDAIAAMIAAQSPATVEPERWAPVLEKILSVDRKAPQRRLLMPLFRWAAAAVILITLSVGGWLYFSGGPDRGSDKARYANDVPPGGNDAILTLADGSEISLTDAGRGKLLETAGVSIVKLADGQLVYTANAEPENTATPTYNTITTPRGGQYQVNLPDGSKVWLNAASSIKFPTSFAQQKERRIELSGEAYFEVAKNKKQPFKVLTSSAEKDRNQEIEVLGTHFNVNAYNDEPETKSTLLEGSVRVSVPVSGAVVQLVPGQQSVMKNGLLQTVNVDTEEAVAWKNGNFIFAGEGIESIMRKISRWYNVEVVYQGKIQPNNYIGTVSRFSDVSEVLGILELTKAVHFKIEGRRITVMP
ncbi:FecR domain-containing protein [Pedobacter africanus]|uniref:FecR family protein n=1 Tax=Pedobacter africanus TaxID=151894 RepID=A0A1W2DXV1_9SPHI|nr:FecR domain-containing protein [Pedobacter africanus]SMD02137.1 FecR family protein [Pedobacter africanus]